MVRIGDVNNVQQQVGARGFFQGGREGGDEFVRQVTNYEIGRASCRERV